MKIFSYIQPHLIPLETLLSHTDFAGLFYCIGRKSWEKQ